MTPHVTERLRDGRLILDRYELLERIGRGGFSTVYSAHDYKMDRTVAVKVVRKADELSDRAAREARIAARLSHPNIVTIFELAEDEDEIFLVTELVEGSTLSDCIASGSLTDRDSIEVALQVLRAVGHAHGQGVVHRDIKPENIMLSARRPVQIKVMDFGIAQLEDTRRITRQGDILGTLAYMSPEQADGLRVDGGTDVYSTAITLYECLTGSNPFQAATASETVSRIQAGAPPLAEARPDLPPELSELLEEAMEPDPMMRLGRAAFAAELQQLLPDIPGGESATTILRRAGSSRLSRAWIPGGRMPFLASRLVNAGLAALVAWMAVSFSDFIPNAWALPLVAGLALMVALLPRAGLACLAAASLLPVAVFSPALGICLAIILGIYYPAIALRRPELALLPALAAALGSIGLGLVYPALSGAIGRLVRGAALALLGALALTLFQLLSGAGTLDYLGLANSYDLPQALAGQYNPWVVIKDLSEPFLDQPALALQPLIWVAAAIPAALLIRWRRLLWDVAGLAISVMVLAGGYIALPYLVPGYALPLAALMKTLSVCVIIQCVLLLLSPRAVLQPLSSYEHTQETRG